MGVTHFFSSPSVKKEWEGLFLKYLLIFFFGFFSPGLIALGVLFFLLTPGFFAQGGLNFDPRISHPGNF